MITKLLNLPDELWSKIYEYFGIYPWNKQYYLNYLGFPNAYDHKVLNSKEEAFDDFRNISEIFRDYIAYKDHGNDIEKQDSLYIFMDCRNRDCEIMMDFMIIILFNENGPSNREELLKVVNYSGIYVQIGPNYYGANCSKDDVICHKISNNQWAIGTIFTCWPVPLCAMMFDIHHVFYQSNEKEDFQIIGYTYTNIRILKCPQDYYKATFYTEIPRYKDVSNVSSNRILFSSSGRTGEYKGPTDLKFETFERFGIPNVLKFSPNDTIKEYVSGHYDNESLWFRRKLDIELNVKLNAKWGYLKAINDENIIERCKNIGINNVIDIINLNNFYKEKLAV